MTDMTHSTLGLPLGREFDNFLFAVVGEGKNGGLVSVLSALARLDLDPWKEAKKLAELPRDTATSELVSFIAAQSTGSLICPEPEITAYRLVALLPRKAAIGNSDANTQQKPLHDAQIPAITSRVIWIAIFFMAMIGLFIIENSRAYSQHQNFNAPELSVVKESQTRLIGTKDH